MCCPQGSRLVVANIGARINNVKAAVFFSLTPKDGVSCPYGDWRLGGEQQRQIIISQTREGGSENLYNALPVAMPIVNAGHPCAWLMIRKIWTETRHFYTAVVAVIMFPACASVKYPTTHLYRRRTIGFKLNEIPIRL